MPVGAARYGAQAFTIAAPYACLRVPRQLRDVCRVIAGGVQRAVAAVAPVEVTVSSRCCVFREQQDNIFASSNGD